jgi:AcrR family transcriptional regulator
MAGRALTSRTQRTAASADELRRSLVAHARELIERDGPAALTMRALANEAGCAVGLPYKVFANRNELVLEVLHADFHELGAAYEELPARAGSGTVADNLAWFAEKLLAVPGVALAHEVVATEDLHRAFAKMARSTGTGPAAWEAVLADYLAAEQRIGRVDDSVDARAFGFLVAGSIHNLIMSGDAYPSPSRARLRKVLRATADAIAPRG